MVCGLPLIGSFGRGRAMRLRFSAGTAKVVSCMPSFDHTRSFEAAPSVLPVIFSTTSPSTSIEKLYPRSIPADSRAAAWQARREIPGRSSQTTHCLRTRDTYYR